MNILLSFVLFLNLNIYVFWLVSLLKFIVIIILLGLISITQFCVFFIIFVFYFFIPHCYQVALVSCFTYSHSTFYSSLSCSDRSSTHIGFLLTHCYSNAVSHSSVKKGVAKEVVPCKTRPVEIGEQVPNCMPSNPVVYKNSICKWYIRSKLRTRKLYLVHFLTLSCGFKEPRWSLNGANAIIWTI